MKIHDYNLYSLTRSTMNVEKKEIKIYLYCALKFQSFTKLGYDITRPIKEIQQCFKHG